jgi:hypothetical protein
MKDLSAVRLRGFARATDVRSGPQEVSSKFGCLKGLTTIAVVGLLSACSVGMALSGNEEPDLGAVKVGTSRGEVEMHLGNPEHSLTLEDGRRVDVYEYEIGNEPSTGRALGHGAMDVLTLGL